MICIVGLGNPGDEYVHTRHNVGWIVLGAYIESHGFSKKNEITKFASKISSGILYQKEIDVLFPTTYMNNSGTAIKKYTAVRGNPEMLIVVHDEIDLPFGTVRVSFDRGAGGHNGIRSLIDAVGPQFVRIRVGVGHKNLLGMMKRPKGESLSKFVLGEFKSGEVKEMSVVVKKVDQALELLITKGLEAAMQEVNKG